MNLHLTGHHVDITPAIREYVVGKLEDNNHSVSTNAWGQTKLTDLYDPISNTWRRCADMAWHREYHAVTVLVPDGRVVTTAGTGGPAQPGISNDVEAFEPPYLFRGIRPRIDAIWNVPVSRNEIVSEQGRRCELCDTWA